MSAPLRILYAEDNPLDADLAVTHFRRSAPDMELEILGTGEMCQERLGHAPFDLLLLDNHLPDLDGIDVLKRLRMSGHRIPVVMLTVVGDEDSVARALLAGADDYVTKAGDYLTRLPDLLRNLFNRAASRPFQEGTDHRVRRVLYVEPHLADAEMTNSHFATHAPHLKLQVVEHASQAFELLSPDSNFDLVMSDLRLPGMNALEFFHEMQRRGIDVPFMVLTGNGDEQTAVALLRLGASDYIVKRDAYLAELPRSIERALQSAQLARTTRRLRADLDALNRSLEQKVAARTAELRWEIRERERAQEELKASSERYFKALENMLEGCQIISPEYRYVYVNQAAARHGRMQQEQLKGRAMSEVYPDIEHSEMFAALKRCMTDRVPVQLDNAFVYENGERAWFELSMQPAPEGVFILSIDITERKAAEGALRESEKNLEVTLQSIGDAVVATDAEGIVTRLNPAAETLTGWSSSEAIGQPLKVIFPIVSAETRAPAVDPVRQVIERGEKVGLANHTTLISRTGREYQIADTAAPIRDDAGGIKGVVLVFKDVSEEYRAQHTMQEREKQLALIADALPGPVSRVSRDGRYVFANAAFARWTGKGVGQIIGRTELDLLGPERLNRALPYIRRVEMGERVTYESAVQTAFDGTLHALITLIPEADENGVAGGHISVVTDITDRRLAEEQLRKSEAMIRIAGRMARLGGWAFDLFPMHLTWTDEVCAIHDMPAGHQVTLEESLGFVAPEWREGARISVEACIQDGAPFDFQVEIITAKNRRVWARATGEAQRNEDGVIVRVHGALQDIDDHKRSEKRISDQLAELMRWQSAVVKREGRSQELKSEVNELRRRLKLPPVYRDPSDK